MTARRQRKVRRRATRLARRAAKIEQADPASRVRRVLVGKSRAGDTAEVRFTFNGGPTSVDPERPVESLAEALARRLPTKGEA